MKVVIARMQHETNTFSPVPTPLLAFGTGNSTGPYYGEAARKAMTGARVAMGAFLNLAAERGCDIVTPLAAMAYPSAPVQAAAYTHMCDTICAAIAQGCDAILLDLHGAMVAENSDDGEGDLLERIRGIAPDTPLSVALDLHGNISGVSGAMPRIRASRSPSPSSLFSATIAPCRSSRIASQPCAIAAQMVSHICV